MTTVAVDTVQISMCLPCDHDTCERHALPLYEQLSVPAYSHGASVMCCPETVAEWRSQHRTARKGAMRAARMGYLFGEVDYSEHAEAIYEINVSRPMRQGRPMAAGYTVRRDHGSLKPWQTLCPLHRTHTYGVISGRTLVAYLTLHRSGDLAMVSMILGHGDHEANGIMYLLIQGVIEAQAPLPGYYYYNLHSSGQDGLRFKKERYGFEPADIEWRLS